MIQGRCRLWNLTLCTLVFLFIYNLILTMKLVYTPECSKVKTPVVQVQPPKLITKKCPPAKSDRDFSIFNLDLSLGRWDNALKYKLFDNILVGEDHGGPIDGRPRTCLATQSSLDRLPSLAEVARHWSGPISVAVFAADGAELDATLTFVAYLRRCEAAVRATVSFHLAVPAEAAPDDFRVDGGRLEGMDCRRPDEVLRELLPHHHQPPGRRRPYPQNHLRNLARKNCRGTHVFLTDVDVVPSAGAARRLDAFLQGGGGACGRCAFVVPTFEVDGRVRSLPANKSELVRLAEKGLARPFHHRVFIYNQFATNFSRWQAHKDDGPDIHVSHPVTNFEFLYEPFYIAPDTVPPHDERFIGYGYTRNSQVYEMFVAGYEFLVLSPIFSCHWGFQVKRSRPPWREHQNNLNRKHFDAFKREIFAKYNKDPLNMMTDRKT